jgi:hypothetical protein
VLRYPCQLQGMGWKLTKFLQLLHFPHNIRRHGSTLIFDGRGCPEYNGNVFCKDHATHTQRRQISLVAKQTAQRYFENSIIVEAERVLACSKALTYKDVNQYQYIPTDEKEYVQPIKADDGLNINCHIL